MIVLIRSELKAFVLKWKWENSCYRVPKINIPWLQWIVQKLKIPWKKQQIFLKAYVTYISLQIVNRRSHCTVNVCLKKLKKQTLIFFFPHLSMHIYHGLMLLEIRSKLLYNNGKRMSWNIWRESIEFSQTI